MVVVVHRKRPLQRFEMPDEERIVLNKSFQRISFYKYIVKKYNFKALFGPRFVPEK